MVNTLLALDGVEENLRQHNKKRIIIMQRGMSVSTHERVGEEGCAKRNRGKTLRMHRADVARPTSVPPVALSPAVRVQVPPLTTDPPPQPR